MRTTVLMLAVLSGCGFQAVNEVEPEAPAEQLPTKPEAPGPVLRPIETRPARPMPEPPLVTGDLQRVVHDTTTRVSLRLDDETVFCSAIGYGVSFLKVSMPDLDRLARFDHRADPAGLPCAAAGACTDDFGPQSILQGRPGHEAVDVRVTLREFLRVDVERQRCRRWFQEDVEAVVRGVTLRHRVESDVEPVPFEQCVVLARGMRG